MHLFSIHLSASIKLLLKIKIYSLNIEPIIQSNVLNNFWTHFKILDKESFPN